MSISIIIPTCKSENLIPCLESIWKYSDKVEIIVVCNGYGGLAPDGCIVSWHDEMIGYPAAVNEGIKLATGDFIVLLNDDTVLLPQEKNDWLNLLSAPFSDPEVAITGPWKMRNTEIERDFICFFCCMIRRSAIDSVGLLDARTFGAGYSEDVDWCCRAQHRGFKIVQVPVEDDVPYDGRFGYGAFPIYHAGNQTFKDHPDSNLIHRNHAILRERYGGVLISNAQKLGEWMSDAELTWLAKQAQKSKVVIELGSWFGKSSTAIADNLPEDGVLYCIDTWAGSAAEKDTNHVQARQLDGDYAYNEFLHNLWRHVKAGNLKPLRMHGVHAATLLKEMGVKADFVFIDAGHTYEEVKEDMFAFAPLVKEGGLMVGHDYGDAHVGFEPWPGVRQAVDEVLGTNFWREPGTFFWITDKPPVAKPNIYECMMFNNEFEILERHLSSMWNVVDRFVIIEGVLNHAGQPKPLHFKENLARFDKYLSKVSHVVVEDFPRFDGTERSAWDIEAHQRNSMMRALTGCKDNDIIVVVDCDEIPNPESVKNFTGDTLHALRMDLYLYDYKVKAKDPWRHGKILPYWQLKQFTATGARYMMDVPDVVPGGEHLSYFGGVEAIQEKIHNTAHRNIDVPQFTDVEHIQHCIENGLDLFDRNIKYEVIP